MLGDRRKWSSSSGLSIDMSVFYNMMKYDEIIARATTTTKKKKKEKKKASSAWCVTVPKMQHVCEMYVRAKVM